MSKNIYIVSGHSGSGKTAWLTKAIDFLKKNNFVVGGVLAPGVWENGEKIAIDSVLYPEASRITLAVRKPDFAEGYSRKWKFDDQMVEKINNHLKQLNSCDYVVIDEIGPLEIIKHQGYTNAIKILEEAKFDNVIVAIRPSLVNKLKDIIQKDYKIQILEVDKNPNHDILI